MPKVSRTPAVSQTDRPAPESEVEATTPVDPRTPVDPVAHVAAAEPVTPPIVIGPESGRAWLFRLTLFGALAWWALLGWLCRTTANPILISPPQWEETELAIRGRQEGADRVSVLETFRGQVPGPTVRVENLPLTRGLTPDREYIWLLTPSPNGYAIVTTRKQMSPPVVYPATEAVLAQLARLSEEEKALGGADLGAPE